MFLINKKTTEGIKKSEWTIEKIYYAYNFGVIHIYKLDKVYQIYGEEQKQVKQIH